MLKEHLGIIGVFIVLFFLEGFFFTLRGATPYTSELGYIEHSSLGQNTGSLVPASCSSVPPTSHFNGDCLATCPGGIGSYDPYFNPTGIGCPPVGPIATCGTANGVGSNTLPSSNLCSSGAVEGGPYLQCTDRYDQASWDCTSGQPDPYSGYDGYDIDGWIWYCHTGTWASCAAPYTLPLSINGACGSSAGQSVASQPASNLCAVGTATAVTTITDCNAYTGGGVAGCIQALGPVYSCPVCIDDGEGGCYTSYNQCTADAYQAKWEWHCNGISGGTQATCIARLGPSPTLKICRGSCASNSNINGQTFTMNTGATVTLAACFGTGSCSTGDNAVSGTWNGTNAPNNAVSVSPLSGTTTTVTGTAAGQENISLTYGTGAVTTAADVTCIPTVSCSSEEANHCQGTVFSIPNNGCGSPINSCTGTRFCDFNFKEVAP